MERPIPHTTPPTWAPPRPGRFSGTIRTGSPDGCALALLGLPDDRGVVMNSGRPGAKDGPDAIRTALSAFGTTYDGLHERDLDVCVYDAGDVRPSTLSDPVEALTETHERVTEAARAIHDAGMIPICLGGGHDLTFPTVRALAQQYGHSIGGLNLDAHLDVRAEPGSGMPFRALIKGGHVNPRCFSVLGAGRFSNSREHSEWLTGQGARIIDAQVVLGSDVPIKEAFSRLASGEAPDAPSFVTIDLDAIDASEAPGVSALNPMGLSVRHAAQVARHAGTRASVRHFDVMELSPMHDDRGRTARIAALLVLTFIAGFHGRNR